MQAIRRRQPPGGLHVLVDGGTAGIIDYVNTLYSEFPIAALLFFADHLCRADAALPLAGAAAQGDPDEHPLDPRAYGALVFIFQEGTSATC